MSHLGLFVPQEVDNELLVIPYEIVRQALVAQVLPKVLSPQGIEGVQQGEFRRRMAAIEVERRNRRLVDRGRREIRVRRRRRRRGGRVTVEETTEQAMLLGRLGAAAKGRRSRRPARILLALVHLLLELLRLLLVHEAQAGEAVLQLEGVEEGPVLVVVPHIEDFLVPDDASRRWLHKGG